MSGPAALVYPLLVQVLLTLVLILTMGIVRVGLVKRGEVRIADMALGQPVWPARAQQLSNSVRNQFETPVLFFVLSGIAMALGADGALIVTLAWIYVASRLAHAAVHVTTNRVKHRFQTYTVGLVALFAMWLAIIFHLMGF